MHVSNHQFQWTPRNCLKKKLVAAIWTQTVTKSSEKWCLFTGKSWLKIYSLWVLGHVWTGFSMLINFFINFEHILYIFRAKKFVWFFTPFSPFFTSRPTSKSWNNPLKVLTEGSMVEYLPVGSQEAPKTIIANKKIPALKILNQNPSPLWAVILIYKQSVLVSMVSS